MNVGKDPFPRDEVTGLAAFDHLEPVGTLNVVQEEPESADDSAEDADTLSLGAASAARPASQRERSDVTLPLDLSAMPHWHEQSTDEADEDETSEADEVPTQAASPSARTSALDAMFGQAAGGGWDDDDEDEATHVHSHPAGRAPSSAPLDMEWDEDEPATEMRPFALFDAPPVAARHDWPEWNSAKQGATSEPLSPRDATSIRSATPTIRALTPPLHALHSALPATHPSAKALSGGRPSPFPPASLGSAPPEARPAQDDDARDRISASPFEGLVPLPAPQLPAAASSALWRSTSARPDVSSVTPERFFDALKAGHRPSIVIALSGAVGLLALVLIVRAIAAGSTGAAVLEVSPPDAQVLVDGKAVSGTSSPYTVSQLTPGNHEVSAKKAGYSDYRSSFAVSSGHNIKLPVIELAANAVDVGFSVRSLPAGAAVWVDGERTEQVTPAKLTGIKPGIHRLVLKHEGYTDYELQMFVPEGTVLQLPAAALAALPSATPEPTRGRRTRARASSSDDSDSYSARRARRVSASETSDSDRPARPERASYTSSYGSRRQRAAALSDERQDARASAGAGAKVGTLRLNSRPWSQVAVDGKTIGNTPQPNLQLSAGKHKIQLSNPQLGLNKTVSVTIKAGETLTQVVSLSD